MRKQHVYLASKPRYEILDGLRGVAALIVVAYHLFETYSKGAPYQIINHGYLAVDFFFVLSGFVIGYAYDDRWDRMSLEGFFKRRITRLHPMVIMGTVIGLLMFYWGMDAFPDIGQAPGWKIALCFILGALMIPVKPSLDIRGWQESYPLNGPQWTLMLEYCGNILYALVIRHLPKWILTLCVAFFAFLTLDFCLGWNTFGLLGLYQGRVIGGWSITPDQLYIGFVRLLYPFSAGLLIARVRKFIKLKAGFWWCSLLLVLLMASPRIGAAPSFNPATGSLVEAGGVLLNGMYEALAILIFFPLIVMMGAGSQVSGKSAKVCKFFGEISFPIYITHYPLMYFQMSWKAAHPEAPMYQHVMLAAGLFILSIFLAYACLKIYDEPVRNWLKEHWLKRVPKRA